MRAGNALSAARVAGRGHLALTARYELHKLQSVATSKGDKMSIVSRMHLIGFIMRA